MGDILNFIGGGVIPIFLIIIVVVLCPEKTTKQLVDHA